MHREAKDHRKAQEERNAVKKLAPLENRLAPAKQHSQKHELKRDDGKVEDMKPENHSVQIDTDHVPPSNDLFYKKDSERHILSGNEDDIDEIVSEVKPHHKKVIKVSESDFETDTVPSQERGKPMMKQAERERDLRNSKKGPAAILSSDQVSKKNNNFVSERQGSRRPKKNLAEDSMTEQSEDERGFNQQNQRRPGDGKIKLSSGSRGNSNLYPA